MKGTLEVIVDELVGAVEDSASTTTVGIGRLRSVTGDDTAGGNGISVLVEVAMDARGSTVAVPQERCIIIPPGIGGKLAVLVPPLVFSLWAWDELSLELGDVAVITGATPLSSIAGQVALWRGGCPVVSLRKSGHRVAGIEYPETDIHNDEAKLQWLTDCLNGKPGFAAIDLDGRSETLDLLMEAMPKWARLMLAGPAKDPVTIDYYNNIHRKGALIITTSFEPTMIFQRETRPKVGEHLEQAFHILQDQHMIQQLLGAVRGAISAD